MTFKEKLKQIRPNAIGDNFVGGCYGCPVDYKLEKTRPDKEIYCKLHKCKECWNRIMPGTK